MEFGDIYNVLQICKNNIDPEYMLKLAENNHQKKLINNIFDKNKDKNDFYMALYHKINDNDELAYYYAYKSNDTNLLSIIVAPTIAKINKHHVAEFYFKYIKIKYFKDDIDLSTLKI